jgi:hypothetical protein
MNLWGSSKIDLSFVLNNPDAKLWGFTAKNASKLILISEGWSGFGSEGFGWLTSAIIGRDATPSRSFGGGGGISYSAGRFGLAQSELDFSRHRLVGRSRPLVEPVGRIVIGYADGHAALKSNTDLVNHLGLSTLDSWWTPSDPQLNR